MLTVICVAVLGVSLSGCFTLRHQVGSGPAGNTQVAETQWYALWGLIPLGKVDSKALAGDATNYSIVSEVTPLDWIINVFTSYVTIYRQTVTVTK